MAYIFNADGVMVSIPNNSPLPTGARWASTDEVTAYVEADTIRAAAGIPAPKSPQQAQLEHQALLENIANRGGLATPQERFNLDTTAQQAGAGVVNRESAPMTEAAAAADLRPLESASGPVGVPRVIGRGETAGDQYVQYEPLPGVAKVVTEEPSPEGAQDAKATDAREAAANPARASAAPESARRESSQADTREGGSTPAPQKAPGGTEGFSTPSERARNSPTSKDKEK